MLVATAVTLTLIGFVTSTLAGLAHQEGVKIIAAFQGRSWVSGSALPTAPATARVSPRYTAAQPEQARPSLRAAA